MMILDDCTNNSFTNNADKIDIGDNIIHKILGYDGKSKDIEPGCYETLNVPLSMISSDSFIIPRIAKILQHLVEYFICSTSILAASLKNMIVEMILRNQNISNVWGFISNGYNYIANFIYTRFGNPMCPTKSFVNALLMSANFAIWTRFRPRITSKLGIQMIHMFVALSGIFTACIAYGPKIYHHFVSILMTLTTIAFMNIPLLIFDSKVFLWNRGKIGPYYCLFVTVIGALSQLLYFLYLRKVNQTEKNDLDFCTSQMLICLRHMSLIIDSYDDITKYSPPKDSGRVNSHYVNGIHDFIPIVGYTFAPFLYLSSPVIPFKEYKSCLNHPTSSWNVVDTLQTALNIIGGLLSFAIDLYIKPLFAVSRVPEIALSNVSTWFKGFYIFISVLLSSFQYYAVWSLGEAIGVIAGLHSSFGDKGAERRFADGFEIFRKNKFVLSTNVYPIQNLFATTFQDFLNTWNFNVNKWAQYYVLKRFWFLGDFSTLVMTMFLAVWHGTHAGYFVFFGAEFSEVLAKKTVTGWTDSLSEMVPNTGLFRLIMPIVYIFQWFSVRFYMCNMGLSFFLLDVDKWWKAMSAINYAPFYFYLATIIIGWKLNNKKVKSMVDGKVSRNLNGLVKKYIASSLNMMSNMIGGNGNEFEVKKNKRN